MLDHNDLINIVNKKDLDFKDVADLEGHVMYIKSVSQSDLPIDVRDSLINDLELIIGRLDIERKKLLKKRIKIIK